MNQQQVSLLITNPDIYDISVDCLYQSTPQLEIKAKPCVINPGKRVEIAILFYPRAVTKYREVVSFLINGLSTVDVVIEGEGTELKVTIYFLKIKGRSKEHAH